MTLPTPHALAAEFSQTLRDWLTPDEMIECVTLNRVEADPIICHSHDHCDANMAMHSAWWELTGEDDGDMDADNQAHADLWNTAWVIAKANDFDPDRIHAL